MPEERLEGIVYVTTPDDVTDDICFDRLESCCVLAVGCKDGEYGVMCEVGVSILRPLLKNGGLDLIPLPPPRGGGIPPALLKGGL